MKTKKQTLEEKCTFIIDNFINKMVFELGETAVSLKSKVYEDYDFNFFSEDDYDLTLDTKYVLFSGDFYNTLTAMTSEDILSNFLLEKILEDFEEINKLIPDTYKFNEIIDFLCNYIKKEQGIFKPKTEINSLDHRALIEIYINYCIVTEQRDLMPLELTDENVNKAFKTPAELLFAISNTSDFNPHQSYFTYSRKYQELHSYSFGELIEYIKFDDYFTAWYYSQK